MGIASDHSLPDLIKLVEAIGDAGTDIVRRLVEADEIVSQAESLSGFTSASERLKTRQLRDKGKLLMADAMLDAIRFVEEKGMAPENSDVSKP